MYSRNALLAVPLLACCLSVHSFACPAPIPGPATLIAPIAASSCDECPIPSVMLVPLGTSESDGGSRVEEFGFVDLSMASARFYNEVTESDPKKDCIHLSENTSFLGSDDLPGLPPSGPVAGGDYMIFGKVFRASTGGGYSLVMSLQDATTREQVGRDVYANFATPDKLGGAVVEAAHAFAPVIDRIREFQRKKRDESNDLAIKAKIKLTPSRPKMNFGEQQSVDVLVYDCDGEDHPLKNRKVTLKSDNGTFDPAEVTTGSDGKAKTSFTATKKGTADLTGSYSYTSVTHKQSQSHGDTTVQIGDPPSGVWQVDIDVAETIEDVTRKVVTDAEGSSGKNDRHVVKRTAHATAWIKAVNDGDGYSSAEILSMSLWGDFTDDGRVHRFGNGCMGRLDGTIVSEGSAKPGGMVLSFTVDEAHANINGTIGMEGSGVDIMDDFDKCRTPKHSHSEQVLTGVTSAIEFGSGSDQLDAPQTTQTRQGKTFTFKLAKHEHEANDELGTSYTKDRTGTITLRALTASQTPPGVRRH